VKRVRPYPFDRLPRLARNQVEAGRSFRAQLPLGKSASFVEAERALGGPVVLRLVECFVARARDLEALLAGVVVRLAAPGERWALVVVERALAVSLAAAALGIDRAREPELPAPRPPTLAEIGAIELLTQLLVEELPVQVVGVVEPDQLLGLLGSLADGALLHVLEARVTSAAGVGAARVLVPDSLVLAAARPRSLARLRERTRRLESVRVHACVELARATLEPSELRAMQRGDVLALPTAAPSRDGALSARLRVGGGTLGLAVEAGRVLVTSAFRLYSDADMANEPASHAADESSTDQLLRELPVEIVCELGRVSMSGRELLELEPGAVIPVGRPLAGPVDLTVGGRLVARGELVDVDGDLGVRLTEVVD
jgi:type III secretion system YscQ/HrcQ family protein